VSGDFAHTTLNDEQSARVEAFLERVEASTSTREFVLSKVAMNRLASARLAPDAVAPDGTHWFEAQFAVYRLTAAGKRAVPGIVIGAGSVSAAQALGTPPAPPGALKPAGDLGARILAAADAAGFDRSRVVSVEDPDDGPCTTTPATSRNASLPPLFRVVPPEHTTLEQIAFQSSWWAYHAAWAADITTTAMFLRRPNDVEQDPLYTMFGNHSEAGVLGSATVVHAAISGASWALYDLARYQKQRWLRDALDAAAFGINAVGVGAHLDGTINNVNLLNH
jgi:hypothetical protein